MRWIVAGDGVYIGGGNEEGSKTKGAEPEVVVWSLIGKELSWSRELPWAGD